jgi:hypothetical protein
MIASSISSRPAVVSLAEIALRVFTVVALTAFLYASGTTFCAAKFDFGSGQMAVRPPSTATTAPVI